MTLGFARVSTGDQNVDGQREALKEAGAGRLFADNVTAPSSTASLPSPLTDEPSVVLNPDPGRAGAERGC